VIRASAAGEALELGAGHGGAQGAGAVVDQREVEAATGRRLQTARAQGVELGQQLPQPGGGDRMTVDLPGFHRPGISGRREAASGVAAGNPVSAGNGATTVRVAVTGGRVSSQGRRTRSARTPVRIGPIGRGSPACLASRA
jgi:hypothetical protein